LVETKKEGEIPGQSLIRRAAGGDETALAIRKKILIGLVPHAGSDRNIL
jgi:hypothetical protein